MASMDDFIVKLKGNKEKLESIEEIVRDAAYKGGSSMEDLLEENEVDVAGLSIDANCHHISLFTYLFGLTNEAAALENLSGRNFISGCSLEDDTLKVYVYGPDGGENFFKRIVELSSDLESCEIKEEEPDEDEEYDDDEY